MRQEGGGGEEELEGMVSAMYLGYTPRNRNILNILRLSKANIPSRENTYEHKEPRPV